MSENIKPVTHQYLFTSPFGNGDVWRDNQATWNGQYAKQSRPLYDQSAIEAARQDGYNKAAADFAEKSAERLGPAAQEHAENDDLRRQLAAAQARELVIRKAIEYPVIGHDYAGAYIHGVKRICNENKSGDTAALDTLLAAKELEATAKAVAETIERCLSCYSPDDTADDWAGKMRALLNN